MFKAGDSRITQRISGRDFGVHELLFVLAEKSRHVGYDIGVCMVAGEFKLRPHALNQRFGDEDDTRADCDGLFDTGSELDVKRAH